jgi:hypothetical protein
MFIIQRSIKSTQLELVYVPLPVNTKRSGNKGY